MYELIHRCKCQVSSATPLSPSPLCKPTRRWLIHILTLLAADVCITSNVARLLELGHGHGNEPGVISYLPLAMTDGALFHSILAASALYMDVYTKRRESPETVKHMKEAIHLLSNRLQDPRLEISDSTLIAVAHLADFEVSISVLIDSL